MEEVASSAPQVSAAATSPRTERLLSLDALRGWDMFWIMGGDQLVRSLTKIYDCSLTRELRDQMEHVPYEGFHFYDLIFPLFIFMVGVAITFSVPKMIERSGRAAAVKRITVRSVILFLLGILYMGGVSGGFGEIWMAGVLQRIASAYFFAALIFCFFEVRAMIVLCAVCLISYWALMTFLPVPSLVPRHAASPFWPAFQLDFSHVTPPSFAHGQSLAYVIDQSFMPAKKFEGTILSTLAAVANVLLGIFAGLLIQNKNIAEKMKPVWLILAGEISLVLGYAWGLQFPIIKVLWTSSYVLVSCGISAILLGIFYQIIDIWKYQRWAQPFVWIGMNAITIYLLSAIVGFRKLADRFVGGDIAKALGTWADFVKATVVLIMVLAVVRFLYRRKIFLRL